MDSTLLGQFVAVAEELHFARAAKALNISPMKLRSSITKLEATLGTVLFDRAAETTRLTKAGTAFLADARRELAAEATPSKTPSPKPGGKAKASKGKGRAPAVKGQPQPGKRRQSR